jgi:predicted glutamine amidotransferase
VCRLFGQLTPASASATPFLIDSPRSLLKQAAPEHEQTDGWGISAGLTVTKEAKAAHESALYRKAAQAKAPVIVAHLRAASNPQKLPREKLLTLENTQPFTDGQWVFAHNGTVYAVTDKRWAKDWRGRNDSEFYFWLWRQGLAKKKDPIEAFRYAVEELRSTGMEKPYTSLNAIVTDGRSLYALCHSRAAGMFKNALFEPGQPWQVMSWRFDAAAERLLVASEPVDDSKEWKRLGPDQYLAAHCRDGRPEIGVGEFKP